MNIDHRNPRLRRGFAFIALAAVLGLSAVGLTQCRLVDDTVTGVDLRSSTGLHGKSSCKSQCREKYKHCLRDAKSDYKSAYRDCQRIHNYWERKACKKAASRAYKDALKDCYKEYKNCRNGCYNEGSGSAGR
jgi:hypothetical protein